MATSTVVATALSFGPVNSVSATADLTASADHVITAYLLPTANPGQLPFSVALEVSPDGLNWVVAASYKVKGSQTSLAHFTVSGIKASKARLRQNDANQGSNALKLSAWISA